MEKAIQGKQIINGTFGEAWIEDRYIDSVIACKGVVKREFTEIKKPRQLFDDYKEISRAGEGEVTFSHVDSLSYNIIAKSIEDGKQESATIISKLADPESEGEERVIFRGCVFPEFTLADWKAATAGEQTIPFKFTDYEIINRIERR